jgi:hypothetical protein
MSNSRRSFLRNTALAGLALGTPFSKELFAMAQKKNNEREFTIDLSDDDDVLDTNITIELVTKEQIQLLNTIMSSSFK